MREQAGATVSYAARLSAVFALFPVVDLSTSLDEAEA
jgi:hypothetical protein